MNRVENTAKKTTEHHLNINTNIWTSKHGNCLTNESMQATKLCENVYVSSNTISAFSFNLKTKVTIAKGTNFYMRRRYKA